LTALTEVYEYLCTNSTASREAGAILEAIGVGAERVPVLRLPDARICKPMILAKVVDKALKVLLIQSRFATRLITRPGT
jgi:hypothetical protein